MVPSAERKEERAKLNVLAERYKRGERERERKGEEGRKDNNGNQHIL
jgi:hypothetical protein